MCLFTTRTHRKQIYHRFFSSFFISIYFAFVLSFSVISFVKFLCLFSRISSAVPLIEENMGAESASSSSNSNCNSSSLQYGEDDISCKNNTSFVVLNVYDLTPINNYMYWFGFGIFHSGIEVYGKEYGFGAHDFPASGVFEAEPKSCPGFIYRCSINLGQIHISPSEFRTFIENMASEYHGDTYHLISKNCNHFTNDVSYRLIGKRSPGWVNRLAKLGALCSCLLPECLQVTSVKQIPEYHECSEDEFADSLSTATPYRSPETDDEQEKHLLSSSGAEDVTFIKESHVR